MTMIRPYQQDCINAIVKGFKKSNQQYVEMPTGAGKTFTFLSYCSQFHKKILVIVPSIQLMRQVYESSLNFYSKKDISRKGDNHTEKIANIHICVMASIKGDYLDMISEINFDLIIIDECHHSQAPSYKRFINIMSKKKILGVTATPDRVDGLLISELLHECSFKITTQELIDQKYLCDIEGFCVKTKIDISDIEDRNGDFSLNKLYKRLSTISRNNMIVDLCKQEMKGRKTLIFCININHSQEITNLLNKKGFPCSHIDGTMEMKERSEILKDFRSGKTNFLCNCQLLTEGFDEPSINGLIMARPTTSRSLFIQMVGRGLRISPGKGKCKIIDIVDNHKLLSTFNHLICDDYFEPIEKFKSIRDIKDHIEKEALKISEFKIERADLLNIKKYHKLAPTQSMRTYLTKNKIEHHEPLSFDEGSFLMWMNELKKEYING